MSDSQDQDQDQDQDQNKQQEEQNQEEQTHIPLDQPDKNADKEKDQGTGGLLSMVGDPAGIVRPNPYLFHKLQRAYAASAPLLTGSLMFVTNANTPQEKS